MKTRPPLSPRPEIASLQPYRVAESAPVKLNQNESALDWPEAVKAEVLRRVAARAWNRYPEVDSVRLREALARFIGTGPEMIAVTNGSNEAILALVEAFAGGQGLVQPVPGYSMVQRLARVGGATVRTIPLRPDFSLDVEAMVQAIQAPDAAMVFLASPNNPTGAAFDRPSIEAVLEASSGLVVIDEAYAGFGGDSYIPDLAAFPHLAVLRTLSKAFALAGVRVGWIVANEPVVAAVRKVLPPYNLSLFAQEAALVALDHADLLEERIQLIVRERNRMSVAMAQIPGIAAYPSQTNFILFSAAIAPAVLYDRLLRRGVLVRDVSGAPLLDRCLRVTVGLPEENDQFLQALHASVAEDA